MKYYTSWLWTNPLNMRFTHEFLTIYQLGVKIWVVNGCGQKGCLSFSEIFYRLKDLPNFIPEKWKECFEEIEKHCGMHDILCEFWGSRTMKFYADMWFTMWVYDRLSWVWFLKRFIFCFWLFYGLHYIWHNAGNFEK